MQFSKLFLAALTMVSATEALKFPMTTYEKEFKSWMAEHEVSFDQEELDTRLQVFADNHDYIHEINSQNRTYTLGHNEYSAMTLDEFHEQMKLGKYASFQNYEKFRTGIQGSIPRKSFRGDVEASGEIDWVSKGAVTPVKNQGQCGSCWSFSTTGALEGAYYLKNGKLVSFSEQNLVDCDRTDGGCHGGLMDNAFDWIKSNGGLCTEEEYPYTARKSFQCKSCSIVEGSAIKSHTDVPKNSDSAMMSALSQQPVSIAIEADQKDFQLYSSGVFTAPCGTTLDHGVLAVGYGTESGEDYYKVKNSWGETWGEKGYIKLARGVSQRGGQCGMLMSASYPSL